MEGDSDEQTPPSHSALRTKFRACIKPRKPRSFEGVDVGNFQDLGTTAATARTKGDSDKRAPPSLSVLRTKLDARIKPRKPQSLEGVDVGDFQDLGTTAATARTKGDSDKRAPPSLSVLRNKLDARIKPRKPRSLEGVNVGDFQDLGTTVATARTEGDSDKRAPPSHSILRTKLDARIKPRKPRSFEGVDVGDFQDLENTAATDRTEGDSSKRAPPLHSALRSKLDARIKPRKPQSFGGVDVGHFPDLEKNCGYRSNGGRLKQTNTTFALGTANQTRCTHKTTETTKF